MSRINQVLKTHIVLWDRLAKSLGLGFVKIGGPLLRCEDTPNVIVNGRVIVNNEDSSIPILGHALPPANPKQR